ncbi:DUF3455 domain-containing protein [Caenimonas aquaedulcis]|uniref:DUF3455 domain-containing protein n=1 Tax=Caenimonas aquaedulcis TaxID=2793270 RepID=A0A931H692_9BURK|nr:DUF3455 domain-containing protein [Caenimonas aquaedulcis]MBG9389439.1 DUF3455 domain-containing protein [Caenimonas aquaedulcis]
MKLQATVLSCALAVLASGCAQTPPALQPSQAELPLLTLQAAGTQQYECRGAANGPQWTFVAPEADLYDATGERVGHHFAGPTWELRDGSRVTATVSARHQPKGADSIPWLLLAARHADTPDKLSAVTSIQRLDTVGGAAPAQGCTSATIGAVTRVPYAARYVFFARRGA